MQPSSGAVADVLDVQQLLSRFSSAGLLRGLASVFREYYPSQLLQIRRAMEAGAPGELRDAARQFESAVGNFCAPRAKSAAQMLAQKADPSAVPLQDFAAEAYLRRLEEEIARLDWALGQLDELDSMPPHP